MDFIPFSNYIYIYTQHFPLYLVATFEFIRGGGGKKKKK